MTGAAVRRPIVVGVENTEAGRIAVAWAADEADRRGLPLRLVHALEWHASKSADVEARVKLAESLAGWKERYPDVVVRPQVAHGHAVRALVDASRKALSLVVGTRGLGGFRGMVLGSVCHGVIHHATCPVVVVPGAGAEPE